ncbi:MAG TPA: hypothetical protein VIO12_04940 [Thermoanaerobaculia bacterium]|jgi:hypothetical protein
MNAEVRRSSGLIAGEAVVLAILLLLSYWRWGKGVPIVMALLFIAPLAYLLYRGEYVLNFAAIAGVAILIFAVVVMMGYRNRLHEEADTAAAMRRVSAALDQYRGGHRGTYPDGAHFANAVGRYDPGIPLNDAWGNPLRYTAIDRIGLPTGLGAGTGYILQSFGCDGVPNPNYIGDVYNWPRRVLNFHDTVLGKDLLMLNGVFVQGPG